METSSYQTDMDWHITGLLGLSTGQDILQLHLQPLLARSGAQQYKFDAPVKDSFVFGKLVIFVNQLSTRLFTC